MTFNRIKRWLFSLRFGIFLFLLMAIYVTFGTLLPQDLSPGHYLDSYRLGSLIIALGFHQTYSSWIFRVIMVMFLVNLTGCTMKMIPSQQRRYRQDYFPSPKPDAENLWRDDITSDELLDLLRRKKYHISEMLHEPGTYHATRNRWGVFASTITHAGIITIILGSFIGNYFAQEGFFNLMPGETATFHQEGFSVQLQDFYMSFREDGSTEQYYSDLLILENDAPVGSETIWVNRPLRHRGMMLYQSSFGWASRLQIKEIETNEVVFNQFLRNDETTFFQPAHLTVHLFGYFPEFQLGHQGMPVTLSQEERNPHYAVILYHFGEFVDSFIMNPSQRFTYQGYEIGFAESVLYTGIIYRKDFGYYAVLAGCLLLMAGLLMAFYFYPKYILVRQGELYAISRQNAWGFSMWLKRILQQLKEKEGDRS
ncbi:cytochrome c biogenesis protein ResB [Anoxynatronum sibiricum]|uniref:Cytochrome c biogenesis protein ResB n=1 Tax=Anoxynatronum sibiricum TaxID=210623 RepID=A0ABU9VXL0_9CLOT